MANTPDGFYDGLGSSTTPAIMGFDRFKTPYRLWEEFTDPLKRPDLSDNEAVEAGIELEDGIAKWAAKKWGFEIEHRPNRIIHPKVPCMQAHVDRFVVGSRGVLEIKNRGLQAKKYYGDEPVADEELDDLDRVQPSEALQVQHQLAVTGYEVAYLAVLIGGQKLLRFTIRRDDAIIDEIEAACIDFWKHVLDGTPPEPKTVDDANRRWPQHSPGKYVEVSPQLEGFLRERHELKERIKDATVSLEICELQIKKAMQDAEEIRANGKKVLSWKTQSRDFSDQTRFKSDNPEEMAAQYIEERQIRVLR